MQKEEAPLSSRGRWKRMTEPILYEVLEATGYLTDGEPAHGVYLSAEAGGQPRFRDFCPDALWRSESALTVYFKYEREDASEEQIAAWQREIWNHGFAPLLWVISPESIAVYNGFSRPREAGNAAAHLLDSFGRIEEELDRLDALAGRLAMETGEFCVRRGLCTAERVSTGSSCPTWAPSRGTSCWRTWIVPAHKG